MAIEPEDFEELIRYLDEHPDVRDQLRRRILSDDFLRLPVEVHELRSAVRELRDAIAELAAAQGRTETGLEALAKEVKALASEVRAYGAEAREYVGPMYEILFRLKAPSLFGDWLRKPRIVELDDLDRVDEAEELGRLSSEEIRDIRRVDLLIRGGDKDEPGHPETIFAVEISRKIALYDLERAERRSELLGRAGYRTRAAVAGREIDAAVERVARERSIPVRLLESVA